MVPYFFTAFCLQVQYKERIERILCLPIPLEAATNAKEVEAYEKRKRDAEEAKIPFKEDPVYLKIGIDVGIVIYLNYCE